MGKIFRRIRDSVFRVFERRDLTPWEQIPREHPPIYGVYHILMGAGWQALAARQFDNLRQSGLLAATDRLFISCITQHEEDVVALREMVGCERVEVISYTNDPCRYEYPALAFIQSLCKRETCLVYYFHSKGITYQSVTADDRAFQSFVHKIWSWREMLEHFIFFKWNVAVNALCNGFDTYGCYRWPPKDYRMYSGSFWWADSSYVRQLPEFNPSVIRQNRFYSEVWLFERVHNAFSAFDTVADLYFVDIPRSIYDDGKPRRWDVIRFVVAYNWRKIQKHLLHYNYKVRCQKRFQQLKK